ncbi:MAG: hypothetical protein AAGH90_07390 [Pseudomonadota bacterium]
MMKTIMTATALGVFTMAAVAEAPPAPPTDVYIAADTQPCEAMTISIYFQNGEAVLSSHAHNIIEDARARLADCQITDVEMVAHTGDARSTGEKQLIGQDRLAIVASTMRDEGLLPNSASARIEENTSEQSYVMARRVDVTLAAFDRNIG